jgi:stage II sporulation protein R
LVRDRILIEAESILEGVESRDTAQQLLEENIRKLSDAGLETIREAGYSYAVKVSVEEAWFPTKEYTDFALPAGDYMALRVVIGEGKGKNWWCVLFPPLCLGGASEKVEVTAAMAGLSREEISLITGEDGSYVIKFKLLELWGELKQKFK